MKILPLPAQIEKPLVFKHSAHYLLKIWHTTVLHLSVFVKMKNAVCKTVITKKLRDDWKNKYGY